jgi:tRNA uridine 5-carbamoylmethylation protein Kti12
LKKKWSIVNSSSETQTEPHPPVTFETSVYRYEEPKRHSARDSPLFTVLRDDPEPPCDAAWDHD